jgi:hypothetical protein
MLLKNGRFSRGTATLYSCQRSGGWNFFGQIYYTSPAPVGEESFILSTEPQPMRIHRCMCIADINPRGICANVHIDTYWHGTRTPFHRKWQISDSACGRQKRDKISDISCSREYITPPGWPRARMEVTLICSVTGVRKVAGKPGVYSRDGRYSLENKEDTKNPWDS